MPLRALPLESAASGACESVHAAPAPSDRFPAARHESATLEPVERRVDRSLSEVECTVAALTETLDQPIAVDGLLLEHRQ